MKAKWLICLILVLLTGNSFAQKNYESKGKINDINFYKYVLLRPANEDDQAFFYDEIPFYNNKALNKTYLLDLIKNRFIKCGLTILTNYSAMELERNGYKKEETLQCFVYIENSSGEIGTIIAFLNDKNKVIYYLHTWSDWSLEKTVEKILTAFENYTYQYDDYFSKKRLTEGNNIVTNNSDYKKDSAKSISQTPIYKIPVSDIDLDVPISEQKHPNRFALIIGNEDYKSFQINLNSESNVEFATNDALSFKEYVIKTLGVPEENVTLLLNAGQVKMKTAITKMKLLAKIANGKAELIFYYAGHGLPDENTKEPYLIPVDVSGNTLSFAVKLKDVYKELSEYPSQRITVILDACFSGGARDQSLLAVRGVRIKPKEDELTGNMVVFTASSEDQSASAYKEKMHGMFTYYLLRKLQETQGDVTFSELGAYLYENVSLKSVLINEKEQNPQTLFSLEIEGKWENWKLK